MSYWPPEILNALAEERIQSRLHAAKKAQRTRTDSLFVRFMRWSRNLLTPAAAFYDGD
jgi:hypothetical protein